MILLLDNYDSFTYNLVDYFCQIGEEVEVRRNDECTIAEIEELDPEAIVISPGPGTPENAGITLNVIEAFAERIPILGVCLGHQAIGLHFGASLVRSPQPMHGKVSLLNHHRSSLFTNLQEPVQVCRYHSLTLTEVKAPLQILALSEDGCVMAIRHESLPITGVQFHPEAILTKEGIEMLKNWINSWRGQNSRLAHDKGPELNEEPAKNVILTNHGAQP